MSVIELFTDWQRSPPALGLAMRQDRHLAPDAVEEAAMRGCIQPALAASKPADFLREVSRRLPLFAALHAKLLDDLDVREHHAADHASISRGYAALEAELVSWGGGLDDVAQAELAVAVATLRRSNETLLQAAPETWANETADLFRATVLVEFLLLCLWSLANSGEHPQISGQIVYSLRYAALDHATAVRNCTNRPRQLDSPAEAAESHVAEDSFWAAAGTLPLIEVGDAV